MAETLAEVFAEIVQLKQMTMSERLDYWQEQADRREHVKQMRNDIKSVKGISDALRMPRVGKIHLGIKKVSKNGNEYPSQTDYFVVTAGDTTTEQAAAAFKTAYGEQPKELTIMFPLNDREEFFPQAYKRYAASGLMCKGNGEYAIEVIDGKLVERDCDPELCPHFQSKQCHLRGHLQVILPELPGLGVWQIDTGSFNSVRNINSAIAYIQTLTGGRIAMIPLKLIIRPHKGRDETGKATNNFVMDIASENIRMMDVLEAAQKTALQVLMPAVDFDAEDAEIFSDDVIDVSATPSTPPVTPPASSSPTPQPTEGKTKKPQKPSLKPLNMVIANYKLSTDLVKAVAERLTEKTSPRELDQDEIDLVTKALEAIATGAMTWPPEAEEPIKQAGMFPEGA